MFDPLENVSEGMLDVCVHVQGLEKRIQQVAEVLSGMNEVFLHP